MKKLSSKWIAKHYMSTFRCSPYWKLIEMRDTIWQQFGVQVTVVLCCTARKLSQSKIIGQYKDQSRVLHRYCAEILRANPRNTVKMKLENTVFQTFYVCFYALRQSFLEGCRPFISIDGCFLKGPFGGILLTVVGRDGNNQMFPIAWAIIEVENTRTWTWFLNLLADDLGVIDGDGYTIMSNQQKWLLNDVANVWPCTE